MKSAITSNTLTTGDKAMDNNSIGLATINEILFAFLVAKVFGVISPKTRIRKVITPVAIPNPLEPYNPIKTTVAKEAAPILTKLFPIKIVIMSLRGFFLILYKASAPFFLCFRKVLTFTELSDIKAVSTPEKKADKKRTGRLISAQEPQWYFKWHRGFVC